MRKTTMKIVFAGGGAPGYLFPGLSVAFQIRGAVRNARIAFAGAGRDFESRNVNAAGFQYFALPFHSAGGFGRAWRYIAPNLAPYREARRFLKRERPDVVVGLGGSASAPTVRAALSMEIPVLLLEYNAVPGAVTEKYADRAAIVCGGFEQIREPLDAAAPVRIVGNPVRASFAKVFNLRKQAFAQKLHEASCVQNGSRQILVLAGTSGAGRTLNEQVPKALYKLRSEIAGWKILHQAGSRDCESTRELYHKLDVPAEVVSFIPDMPRAILRADLAITRPGGITLAELAAGAVPAVTLPSPLASERHQSANAEAFAQVDACWVVDESTVHGRIDERIAGALREMIVDESLRRRMAAAMARLARPDAAWQIAAMVLDLARWPAALSAA
jgi:UDP-N-acetylglucosamine--N-acetylmuramyl-(pentapeptide) pyrophosphoryl-undecaprenol N-acetylglucosamine transferase